MVWEPPIYKSELNKLSDRPNYRIRLFTGEVVGDGFFYKDGDGFFVCLDHQPNTREYLVHGQVIGIQPDGKIGFDPRMVDLETELPGNGGAEIETGR